ncbi:hydrogenase expression/formation protein [Methylococcus sp. EFPC2]|uniref:hydrogenase expression/formation protein n=1 Tax=Methylococcus sp. EFPC2 TaxID=2812648 RepID=UPI001967443F|nr:hydrogenase expression/formation protein [Methylococcus sp. EFPC2]QSA97327.1 hydrogenase expression/formation protein [Methylococcus sp. EFPC2]
MKPFPIPVVGELPFTLEEEGPSLIVESPGDMAVFRMPARYTPTEPAHEQAACEVIERLLGALGAWKFGEADYPCLELDGLDAGSLRVLHETLGEGEVGARLGPRAEAQETAFAGIWWLRTLGPAGEVSSERLEACAIPEDVRRAARGKAGIDIPPATAGLMNAPALIAEIAERSARYRVDGTSHVINLTLLPVTPEDLEYLDATLGRGGVSLLSRGYGNCRITATAVDGVWWVQYFNASDKLILNTLEITGLPEAALAAPEDLADSVERLAECLAALREG